MFFKSIIYYKLIKKALSYKKTLFNLSIRNHVVCNKFLINGRTADCRLFSSTSRAYVLTLMEIWKRLYNINICAMALIDFM